MNARRQPPGCIHSVKVTEEPSGDNFRRIVIDWVDNHSRRQRRIFMGDSAIIVHEGLATCAAISDAARECYIAGLITAFVIISEKLPQLAVV